MLPASFAGDEAGSSWGGADEWTCSGNGGAWVCAPLYCGLAPDSRLRGTANESCLRSRHEQSQAGLHRRVCLGLLLLLLLLSGDHRWRWTRVRRHRVRVILGYRGGECRRLERRSEHLALLRHRRLETVGWRRLRRVWKGGMVRLLILARVQATVILAHLVCEREKCEAHSTTE